MAVIRALRLAGHDVQAVAETRAGSPDEAVAALALVDGRILLTEDRDFGRLAYTQSQQSGGVIFMRYPSRARSDLARDVAEFVQWQGERLIGTFVVMQPRQTRIGRLPDA